MKGYLSRGQIEYVLFHMNHKFVIDSWLKDRFHFMESYSELNFKGRIVFLLTPLSLNVKNVKDIPVLFASKETDEIYSIINDNLVFHHDLVKSAFYLLSGFQEIMDKSKDQFGRFPYKNSLQYKLKIPHKPLVNYYFDIIKNGVKEYCDYHTLNFQEKKVFSSFGFMLTHDVDRLDANNFNDTVYKIKQFLGLSPSHLSRKKNLIKSMHSLYHFINPFSKSNSYWTFEYLTKIEKKYHINSVYYFLNKDQKYKDSLYDYSFKRVRKLIGYLKEQGSEIGLHGTIKSANDVENLKYYLDKLERNSGEQIIGVRQHFLKFDLPTTILNHEKAGLQYDSTLGFAEEAGFRNSYCLPFKLFDFKENRMIDVWEIPLNFMEVTFMGYKKYDYQKVVKTINQLLDEIEKFNGIFTLLWHNCNFDEVGYPAIKQNYEEYLQLIMNRKPINLTGKDVVRLLNKHT